MCFHPTNIVCDLLESSAVDLQTVRGVSRVWCTVPWANCTSRICHYGSNHSLLRTCHHAGMSFHPTNIVCDLLESSAVDLQTARGVSRVFIEGKLDYSWLCGDKMPALCCDYHPDNTAQPSEVCWDQVNCMVDVVLSTIMTWKCFWWAIVAMFQLSLTFHTLTKHSSNHLAIRLA